MVQEACCGHVVLALHALPVNGQGQVLGHDGLLVDSVNADLLKVLSKAHKLVVAVESGAVHQASGPSKDAGNAVGRGLVALLVFAVVSA